MDPDMVPRELYDAMRQQDIEVIERLWLVVWGLAGVIGAMGLAWWRYAVGQARRAEAQIDDLLERLKEVPGVQ